MLHLLLFSCSFGFVLGLVVGLVLDLALAEVLAALESAKIDDFERKNAKRKRHRRILDRKHRVQKPTYAKCESACPNIDFC